MANGTPIEPYDEVKIRQLLEQLYQPQQETPLPPEVKPWQRGLAGISDALSAYAAGLGAPTQPGAADQLRRLRERREEAARRAAQDKYLAGQRGAAAELEYLTGEREAKRRKQEGESEIQRKRQEKMDDELRRRTEEATNLGIMVPENSSIDDVNALIAGYVQRHQPGEPEKPPSDAYQEALDWMDALVADVAKLDAAPPEGQRKGVEAIRRQYQVKLRKPMSAEERRALQESWNAIMGPVLEQYAPTPVPPSAESMFIRGGENAPRGAPIGQQGPFQKLFSPRGAQAVGQAAQQFPSWLAQLLFPEEFQGQQQGQPFTGPIRSPGADPVAVQRLIDAMNFRDRLAGR